MQLDLPTYLPKNLTSYVNAPQSIISHLRNYRPKPIATFAASVFGIKSVQCWRTLMPCNDVSYVMEFLAWWVLESKVFAQKSNVK